MRRAAVLAAAGLVAVVAGCNYGDADFTTRCGGSFLFRAIDADGTHEVVVAVPGDWMTEAEQAEEDIVKEISLPSDVIDVRFDVGHDLDALSDNEMTYCRDFEAPSPVIDETLTAESGSATIVLHPTSYWRNTRADLTLEDVEFSDGDTKVVDLEMIDYQIGNPG